MCSSTVRRGNLKTQQSPVSLDLCLRKTRSEKSRDYRAAVVFQRLRFQSVFRSQENEQPAFLNSCGLNSVFESSVFVMDWCKR